MTHAPTTAVAIVSARQTRRKAHTPIERFLALVQVGETPDACWTWTGATTRGYGVFHANSNGLVRAHRWSYEHYVGPIPDGLHIDHLCRVRLCVNPAHLEPVTQRENNRRGFGWSGRKARQTHCKYGHEFTPENTIIRSGGRRNCRICRSRWGRATCEAATGFYGGEFGIKAIACDQQIGLRTFTDRAGMTRRYCSAAGHERAVRRRFGVYVSEVDTDGLTAAKAARE